MTTNFLHGVRTIEYDDGTQDISTENISVIGVVGTAMATLGGAKATAITGSPLVNNQLLFKAAMDGVVGNTFSITIGRGHTVNTEQDVTEAFLQSAITFERQPGGSVSIKFWLPVLKTTGAYFLTPEKFKEIMGDRRYDDPDGSLDCSFYIEMVEGDTGKGIIKPTEEKFFSGGEDEPFPVGQLSFIAGSDKKAKYLGATGTLPAAVQDILNQHKALIIVSRVLSYEDPELQQNAVIQGLNLLTTSGQKFGITPRILIAPDFSCQDPIAAHLEVVVNRLRGVGYIDSPEQATPEQVATRRQSFGARMEILRPRVYTTNDISGKSRPYSPCAAGLRSRIDNEKGFWWSKSNQQIMGITGLEQFDEFAIGDENCTANLLNATQVSTIIRRSGYRHWGNYLCSMNPQWAFECVRRTADLIEDSIAETVQDGFIDRPIDVHLGDDIIETINAFLRKLYELGAINGGKAWLDGELNTKESLAAGNLYINVDFAPKSPAQTITITYRINNDYTVEEFASLLVNA